MKNIIGLLIILLLSVQTVFSADMRFVQVDGLLHSKNSPEKFDTLIKKLNKEKDIEFIIFTGNNIAKPNKEDLIDFTLRAKQLKRPYYIVLGQKDVNKQKDLSKKEYLKILQKKVKTHKKITSPNYFFIKKGILFVVADGSKEVIPTPNGYYRENVILWLDELLDEYNTKKVIILQHYPLVPPAKRETYYTHKASDYLDLLSEHKNVKAIFAGHFDVNNEQTVDGILHVSTKNAPTYRVVDIIDYDTENPTFWSTIKE